MFWAKLGQCCCDRKSRAACAQSFALWQQATIEITQRDHSLRMLVVAFNRSHVNISRDYTPRPLNYCLFVPHIYGVVLRAHSVRGEPRISVQRQWSGCNNTMCPFGKCANKIYTRIFSTERN